MEINDKLWHEAQLLAARSYTIEQLEDTLSDGQLVIVLTHPELPGCISDGATLKEAEDNLVQVRTEYIYLLLVDGLPVPAPRSYVTTSTTTSSSMGEVTQIRGANVNFDRIEDTEKRLTVVLEWDFVKQS